MDWGQQKHMVLLSLLLLGDASAADSDSFLSEQSRVGDLPASLNSLKCNAYYS